MTCLPSSLSLKTCCNPLILHLVVPKKYPYRPQRRLLKITEGRGVSKSLHGGTKTKKTHAYMHGRVMSIMDIFWHNTFQLEQEIKSLIILYSTSSLSKARKPQFTSTPCSPFTTEKVDNPRICAVHLLSRVCY